MPTGISRPLPRLRPCPRQRPRPRPRPRPTYRHGATTRRGGGEPFRGCQLRVCGRVRFVAVVRSLHVQARDGACHATRACLLRRERGARMCCASPPAGCVGFRIPWQRGPGGVVRTLTELPAHASRFARVPSSVCVAHDSHRARVTRAPSARILRRRGQPWRRRRSSSHCLASRTLDVAHRRWWYMRLYVCSAIEVHHARNACCRHRLHVWIQECNGRNWGRRGRWRSLRVPQNHVRCWHGLAGVALQLATR